MKWLSLIFIVRLAVPFGPNKTYEAKDINPGTFFYLCTLTNDKRIYVPVLFTVIEEK